MTLECVEALEAQIDAASGSRVWRDPLHPGVPVTGDRAGPSCGGAHRRRPCDRVPGPPTPDRPSLQALLELGAGASAGLHRFALVLDFSIAMQAIPTTFADAVCSAGMARGDLDRIFELWRNGGPVRELFAAITETGAPGSPKTRRARGSCVSAVGIPPPGRRSCHWLRTRTQGLGRS